MRTAVEMADFCFGWEDLNDPEVRDRLVAKRIEEAKKRREEAVSKGRKPDSIFWGDSESNLTYDGALSSIKGYRETQRKSWNYVAGLFLPIERLLEPGIGQTWGPNDEVVYAGLSIGTGLKYRGLVEDMQKANIAVGLTRNRCIIADSTKKREKAIRIISYDDILRVYYDDSRVIVSTTTGGDVGFSLGGGSSILLELNWVGIIYAEAFVQIVECYRKGVQYEAPRPDQKFTQAPQATPQTPQATPQTPQAAPPTEPPQAAPQAAAPAAPPAGVGLSAETVEALKQFKELLDAGILTQEEFDGKKKQLLGL